MINRYSSMIVVIFALFVIGVNSQQCLHSQTYITPKSGLANGPNTIYTPTCCDSGTASQARNWAMGNDGCGYLMPFGSCQNLVNDIALSLACSPHLVVNELNQIVVSDDYAKNLYDSCKTEVPWCLDNKGDRLLYSGCQSKKIMKKDMTGKTQTYSLVEVYDPNVCTKVLDLTYKDFAETLKLIVAVGNQTYSNPSSITFTTLPVGTITIASSSNKIGISFIGLLVSCVTIIAQFI